MDDIRPQKTARIIGQKLLLVTRKGAALIHRRLLMGHQTYYDNCILELIRANVAIRDSLPLAGSRAHYSLVDGGKAQREEMAVGK